MRSKRPSRTSSLVTMLRALAHEGLTEVRDFQDPTAWVMLPRAWRLLTRFTLRRARNPRFRERLFNERNGGRSDLVALRTKVFDDAWHAAHAAGVRQLVLLGAGLDGRAFRLEDLGDSSVFEVDHPDTQALKRERAAQLTPRAGRHLYVPVNFEKGELESALEVAGHRADAPTLWIWEGVTPYLTRDAQRATTAALARRSATGSRLAMTYVEPPQGGRRPLPGIAVLVRFLGEPFIGLLTRAQAAELLETSGFRVVEDTDAGDWRKKYSTRPDRAADDYPERIALAEKL